MKTEISDLMQELTVLRNDYAVSDNPGGVRVAQQALTLAEVYSKYDFTINDFFGYLHTSMAGFAKLYEPYEIEESAANKVVQSIIERYQENG